MTKNYNGVARCALMVHGAGGGGWEWNIWQRVFAAHGWQVSAPDLQPAESGLSATRIEHYIEQVSIWLKQSPSIGAASPPVLIGASLGGLLTLHAATSNALAALVLINPIAPATIASARIDARPPTRAYPSIVRWGSERSIASTLRAMPDADDAVRLFALRRWRDESGSVLNAAAEGLHLQRVRCPTLVIASEHDVDTPPAASYALADACAAEFRLLPGASHLTPLLGRRAGAVAEQALRWCLQRGTNSLYG